jgi:hypothetical protein
MGPITVTIVGIQLLVGLAGWGYLTYKLRQSNAQGELYNKVWAQVYAKLAQHSLEQAEQTKKHYQDLATLFFFLGTKMAWPEKGVDLEGVAARLRNRALAVAGAAGYNNPWPGGFRALPELTYQQDNILERRVEVDALLQHLDTEQLVTLGNLLVINEEDTLEQALIKLNITPLTPAAFD